MTDSLGRRQLLAAALGGATAAVASAVAAGPAVDHAAVPAWDRVVDVLVVGGGAAGVCAAIEARAAGASVILLESMPHAGGSSAVSGGVIFAGGGTFMQRALGVSDTPDAMYDAVAGSGAPGLPLERLRLYCEQSATHLAWLRTLGVPYADTPQLGTSLLAGSLQPAVPRCHRPQAPEGLAGQRLMQALLARARRDSVLLLTGVSAQRLVVNAAGRVTGVQTLSGTRGGYTSVRRAVVLSCGGFIQQRDMVRQFAPQLYDCATPWGVAGELGLGVRLGMSAGGAALRMAEGFSSIDLSAQGNAPSGLLVNAAGQRFIAEDAYAGAIGHAVTYRQDGRAWLITDAASNLPEGQQDYPRLAEAVSIGELSEHLGLPRGALQQSVAYYNRYAARGEDPQFGKSRTYTRPFQGPPYRAWAVSGPRAFFPAYTLGGLATDLDGAVLDAFGEPVTGLCAAGRTAAGLPTAAAGTEGLSLADATFFGRRAGRRAATELPG